MSQRFFGTFAIVVMLFLLSFLQPRLLWISKTLLYVWLALVFIDFLLLFAQKSHVSGQRVLPDKLSNGDYNPIYLKLHNTYSLGLNIELIDEIPFQFQKRDFRMQLFLSAGDKQEICYQLRPIERGVYQFGKLNIFAHTALGLVKRRFQIRLDAEVAVYPSFLQLRKFELIAFSQRLQNQGLKKIRRIGHTLEFEQIKEYIPGDDIRNINWKSTAKRAQLMVNQYQDEKSQPIYSIIDTGRVMKMPFDQLALLDYAINATLVISGVAIKKQDKAGMLCFSKKVDNLVMADKKIAQMQRIMETLYRVKTDFAESDFSRLYIQLKRQIRQRSLLLLYTNFETLDALRRQLPFLQAIAKNHLLVVIFFQNTELNQMIHQQNKNVQNIFNQTMAEKFVYEKHQIVRELHNHGIQAILSKPENLTINTLNKYLEIKARGML
ncbi:MAG: DUF58 domain-containing protein [Flavobacteriaceae bacterium]|nr:DUF58 domain-containing protein [Flavobacteriaceae bacterium]